MTAVQVAYVVWWMASWVSPAPSVSMLDTVPVMTQGVLL